MRFQGSWKMLLWSLRRLHRSLKMFSRSPWRGSWRTEHTHTHTESWLNYNLMYWQYCFWNFHANKSPLNWQVIICNYWRCVHISSTWTEHTYTYVWLMCDMLTPDSDITKGEDFHPIIIDFLCDLRYVWWHSHDTLFTGISLLPGVIRVIALGRAKPSVYWSPVNWTCSSFYFCFWYEWSAIELWSYLCF